MAKVVLRSTEVGSSCWALRTAVAKLVSDDAAEPLMVRGKRMRCVIESKPSGKPMLRSGAKAIAFFAERDIEQPQLK